MVLMTPFNILYTLPSFVAKKNSLDSKLKLVCLSGKGFAGWESLNSMEMDSVPSYAFIRWATGCGD
jgi:hypothetical protein